MVTIKLSIDVEQEASIEEIVAFRCRVWAEQLGSPASEERFGVDTTDDQAIHITVRSQNELVAAARLSIHESALALPDPQNFAPVIASVRYPCAVLSRLVVHPDWRGQGLATEIDNTRIELAQNAGVKEIWAEVQGKRVDSLKSRGFECVAQSADTSVPGDWYLLRLTLL